ncbi:kinetochore protein SPC24 homolog, partial [Diospyros lotus]|uniref:kinetochore protein SPC24 homolog n=1 Tax=Diospyros lotus TaxID=55363 RepID=UPI0022579778
KAEEAKSEIAADAEMDVLQDELEEELQRERLLREDIFLNIINTEIINEISVLERQRVSVEEERQTLKKLEQDELRAHNLVSILSVCIGYIYSIKYILKSSFGLDGWNSLKTIIFHPRIQEISNFLMSCIMNLSMYASVTKIIPNLDDHSKISGHTVERDKKVVEKFEFNPEDATAFDTCNSIWKMISLKQKFQNFSLSKA